MSINQGRVNLNVWVPLILPSPFLGCFTVLHHVGFLQELSSDLSLCNKKQSFYRLAIELA